MDYSKKEMKEPNKNGNKQRALWLPDEVYAAAKKFAKQEGVTMSEFVRLALIDRITALTLIQKMKKELEKKRQ